MKKFSQVLLMFFALVTSWSLLAHSEDQPKPTSRSFATVGGVSQNPFPNDEGTRKIFKRTSLEEEARQFAEQGRYEEAVLKYKEALDPGLIEFDYQKATAIGGIVRCLRMQRKYEEALKEFQWFIDSNPNGEGWADTKHELDALIKARDTESPEPVYEHIKYLRGKYQNMLPPKALNTYSDTVASTVFRLYDHIGDYDGGIAFADEFIRYYAKRWGIKPEEIGTKNQYFEIKQAFLQDRAEGRKSCLSAKPGEACVGRATKALIQSDYFPW